MQTDDRDDLDLDDELDDDGPQEGEVDPFQELARVLALPSNQRKNVSIFRSAPGGPPDWLVTWRVPRVTLEEIRKHFGGGGFRLQLLRENGRIEKVFSISLAGRPREPASFDELDDPPPPPPKAPEPEPEVATVSTHPLPGGGDDLDELRARLGMPTSADLRIIGLIRDELRGPLSELRNPNPAFDRADPAEMALNIVKGLREAIEPLQQAILDREAPEVRDPMDYLMQGIELGANLGGKGGGGVDTAVRELAAPLIETLRGRPGAAEPGANHNPPPQPEPELIDFARFGGRMPGWVPMLQPALPQLIEWARQNRDPELRAQLILEDIPSGYLGPLVEQLTQPTFPDEFYAAVPAAAPLREWFEAFRLAIVRELTEEGDSLDPTGEVGHHAGDANLGGVDGPAT